ncbi:MAG: hypothetical protein ABI873_13135 [Marmoricola sp.]
MSKYLLSYHGGGMPESEEEGAKITAAWGAWMGQLGAAMVDGGNPTGQSATIAADGSTSQGGGANPVTGYSVIEADGLDAAVELAKGCPILLSGGSIEVGETFDVM